LIAAACVNSDVSSPPAGLEAPVLERMTCSVQMADASLRCAQSGGGANKSLTLGGPGTYVQVFPSNGSYASGVLQADVSIRNLTSQLLGTSDGSTVTGVKAFIATGPTVTSGTGVVTVNNADGTGTFTAANQSYWNYNEILDAYSGTSSPKTWKFNAPATVNNFTFTVLISAAAPAESGVLRWVPERGTLLFANAVFPIDANNVFACGNSECYRSTPQGWLPMGGRTLGDSVNFTVSILAMGGTSANDLWAGGGSGGISHFDGRKWSNTPVDTGGQINAITAIAANDVYAVGLSKAKIYHYDGNAWSSVFTMTTSGGTEVRALNANDVWVAGVVNLYHWNGSTWSTIAMPSGQFARGLWVVADNDIWVGTTAGKMYHFDGATFTAVTTPSTQAPWGFVGFGANDIYTATGTNEIWHWDGASWTLRATVPTTQVGHSFYALSATSMYLAGYNGTGQVHQFDGTNVTTTNTALPNLQGVWGTSASNIYAVGTSGFILHNSGTGWVTEASGTSGTINTVRGANSGDVWAVGALGTAALRRTNGTWTSVTKATGRTLHGLYAANTNAVFAVGDTGTIEAWTGTSWTSQASGFVGTLRGIAGVSPLDVYAVGDSGKILHYNGSVWSTVTTAATSTNMQLTGVWVNSSNDILVAGTQAGLRILLKYNGSTWTNQANLLQGPGAATCVGGSGATVIWLGGGAAGLLHYDGTSWTNIGTGFGGSTCPWSTSATNVYAVGSNGVILHGIR
jgi:hypothetical protein